MLCHSFEIEFIFATFDYNLKKNSEREREGGRKREGRREGERGREGGREGGREEGRGRELIASIHVPVCTS